METINLNSREIRDVLDHMIVNNLKLANEGKVPVAFEIIGDPGLGKTSICFQAGKAHGMEVIKLNIAQFDDLCDLVGFPYKEFHVVNSDADEWVHEDLLSKYIEDGWNIDKDSVPRMSYAVPEWIANRVNPVILILDDWTRADQRFIQAVMELVATQKYGSWSLPMGSTIVLTSNPDNGDNMVKPIDDAMRTRFISLGLKWNAACWAEWAEDENVPNSLINFVIGTPELVTASVNPRAIMNFFNSIHTIYALKTKKSIEMMTLIGSASIGSEAVEMLKTFLDNHLDVIPTVDEMMIMDIDILKQVLKKCAHSDDGKTFNPAVSSIVATRLVNYCTRRYKNKEEINVTRVSEILSLDDVFSADILSYMANTLINLDATLFSPIVMNSKVASVILS